MSILRHKNQKNNIQDKTTERISKIKKKKKKRANRQILQITYIFVVSFLALIAYIAHFVAVDSKNVITNAHNRRLQSMAEKYEERSSVVMEKCWHRHLLKMDQRSEIILMAECLHML